MGRAPRTAFAAALGALCLAPVLSAPPAEAAPAVGVVELLSGLLSVSVVPPTASLTTGSGVASGSLGTTTVIDGRSLASSYDVSVSTAGFDLVGALSSTSATHIAASAVTVQNTAVSGGTASRTTPVALPSATPVFRVSYPSQVLSVNLLSTYTLSISLTLPAGLAAGLYTGVVTQTVA